MNKCTLCPRACGADRTKSEGLCGVGANIKIARAALHHWEEPCISFKGGSGTVFFSGCNMHCIYCQNKDISTGKSGLEITAERFYDILFELKAKGAENINLVTAGHFLPQIIPVLKRAKNDGLNIPIVYNTSSYERVDSIKQLNDVADIYLPDLKYISEKTANQFSHCRNYFEIAAKAIDEMVSQKKECVFNKNGKLLSGVIVRHLVLPGHTDESKEIIKYLYNRYGDSIYMSIMSQYTPIIKDCKHTELLRRLTADEYNDVIDFAVDLGIENAFVQEGEAAEESFIPPFDLEGVLHG